MITIYRFRKLLLLICILLPIITSCDWFNQSPFASIIVSTFSGEAPLTVDFNGLNSFDSDGRIESYFWNFGDGNQDYGSEVSHTFQDDGTFLVTLSVTDNNGSTGSDSVTISVSNPPPRAEFTYSPASPTVGETVTFDASISYDPASELTPETITSYNWYFGDGYTDTGITVSHIFSTVGSYEVTLQTIDDDGEIDTRSKTVTVKSFVPDYYYPTYSWEWNGAYWNWEVQTSRNLYDYFHSQPRSDCFPYNLGNCDYGKFVLNSEDDLVMSQLSQGLNQGINDYFDRLENTLYFVQGGIRYDFWESPATEGFQCSNCPEPITQDIGQCEYPRYPVETLVTGYGDCEDTSILYTSLIRSMGEGAKLADIPMHMAGLAPLPKNWVQQNLSWLTSRCENMGLFFNAFQIPGEPDQLWLWAETAVDGIYIPLGCYSENLESINYWDVSSNKRIRIEALY